MIEQQIAGIGMTSQRTRDRLIKRLRSRGIADNHVLEVLSGLPRHLFLEEAMAHSAYDDVALPIGFGQTISQPFIVARMTELLLERSAVARVLEIGTGSGYQTCVLSMLVESVYTVERIKALQSQACRRLNALKRRNIHFCYGDGCAGWESQAPFDGIIVTAAPVEVPMTLLRQLNPGGVMVIPLGISKDQHLCRFTANSDGFGQEVFESVRFVPLVAGSLD